MEFQQAEEEKERQLQDQQQLQSQEHEKQEVVSGDVVAMKADPPSALTTPSSAHSESTGNLLLPFWFALGALTSKRYVYLNETTIR